jgi:hypothetical protein
MLALLALVTWALGVRGASEARARSLEGLKATAAASSVALDARAEPPALAEWIARESGYRIVSFVTPEGRVVASTDSTVTTSSPPATPAAQEHQGALWAPLRKGSGSAPFLWLRVVPSP